MTAGTSRQSLSWTARFAWGLLLLMVGAALATWGLARWETGARFFGVAPPQPQLAAQRPPPAAQPPAPAAVPLAAVDATRIAALESRLGAIESQAQALLSAELRL